MKREEKLRELMLRYLEGEVEPEELERLNQAVETDLAARRQMAELMLQETLLSKIGQESEFFELQSDATPELRPSSFHTTSRILKIQRAPAPTRRGRWTALAAAAALLFAVSLYLAVQAPRTADLKLDRTAAVAPDPVAIPQPEAQPENRPAPEQPASADPKPALPVAPDVKPAPRPIAPTPAKSRTPDVAKVPPAPVPAAPEPGTRPSPAPANVSPVPLVPASAEPAVRYWETVIARIDRVQGEVTVLAGAVRKQAKAGENFTWGQGIETAATGASVLLRFPDGTRLELGPRTVIWETSDRPGAHGPEGPKRIRVAAGTVTADVAKQTAGRPMLLMSPHGEAKILGTSFKLTVEAESMRLEMKEGKIQVTRKDDQATVDISGGFFVVVGKGIPMDVKLIPPPEKPSKNSGSK